MKGNWLKNKLKEKQSLCFKILDLSMRVYGKEICLMEKERRLGTKLEKLQFMRVSTSTVKNKVKVVICLEMIGNIKVSFQTMR